MIPMSFVAMVGKVGGARRGVTVSSPVEARPEGVSTIDQHREMESPVYADVAAAGRAARAASEAIRTADHKAVTHALELIARHLRREGDAILEANRRDVQEATPRSSEAFVDRLQLDETRLEKIATQILTLASCDDVDPVVAVNTLASGVRVEERRRPVGVIGANYEARPNVTVDIASQLLKSRNAGVLRTGSAALGSASVLLDVVVRPAYAEAGLDPEAIQLIRSPDREGARACCSFPDLIPLVILRGSGPTTAELARHAAGHGVRTLAHADGGGVLFLDRDADPELALRLIRRSVDRLGVCNRLNLLLVAQDRWDELLPLALAELEALGITPSLPPHAHALGHEWALDDGNEAHVTVAPASDPEHAARLANEHTSGLAAGIVTADAAAANAFLDTYAGTGAFWNVTTRLLDGFELTGAPETGINVDKVPGPRGPVTYRDLYVRQYVVTPAR
jgi:glutamate-5-semialdehyde dehydrogenase